MGVEDWFDRVRSKNTNKKHNKNNDDDDDDHNDDDDDPLPQNFHQ